jgi:hypothetical protein
MELKDCAEFQGLWREFAKLNAQHFNLDLQLQKAVTGDDDSRIAFLTSETEKAAALRDDCRKTIRQHEISHARVVNI